ncbi:VOC family protein [Bosea rubneri]|uniref:VOC family protein n=1 Tax=Bosea rubneri TaxID=3075434 RepID=A0ABU3SBQ0_9HYPH|nr:VOC family protein [Bosea sp. ZW T0_25]MDU0342217.1 VOC family protein [Bosea sp. ZW T0_25]
MEQDVSLGLAIFVEHGREREAADFYGSAFGARQFQAHHIDGALAGVEMRLGATVIAVAGANPRREAEPSRGGPFFPKVAGGVSTIIQLTVPDIDGCFAQAIAAGATLRDEVQTDVAGRRVASLFDPFGHIWVLIERDASAGRRAA